LAAAGDTAEAQRALAGTAEGAEPDRVMASARVALAGGTTAQPPRALAERAQALADEARLQSRGPAAWRLGAVAARLAERAGAREQAQAALAGARATFEEVRMATPQHHRPGLEADP